ncbi:MAG: ABC transporter ATP-binding protein [Candidatus Bathyarchaeota archaeon]|nr:ABC transporter ATP-binding protein [Candidatus Bathyarchaeota archaeon]
MVNLKIENVACYYDSAKILEDVCFSVETGTFLGILGPNGSGKTTLLKSISRVLKPRKGTIVLDNSDIYSMKNTDVAKSMAVVPQDSNITFSFKSFDIVLMGRTPHLARLASEGAKDIAIAKQAMEYTGTIHLANRLITELSGGERQRVIIARALTQQPKILLLDEPTSHLDISNQLEIMDLLKQLCVEKKLLIVGVFHDFNLAARYCDSIIMLKDGKIVAAGKASETLTCENIRNVFGINVIVNKHPVTDLPFVIPVSKPKDQRQRSLSVHLISGAGTGSTLMKILTDSGYNVTAGVLNVLDTDFSTAQYLKIPVVSEAPFSPVTEKAQKANLEMIRKASIVVLASVPFGSGNLQNLEAAKEALKAGIATYVLDEVPIEIRDFTGGKAKTLFSELKKLGAVFVNGQEALLHLLNVSEQKAKEGCGKQGAVEQLKEKDDSTENDITNKVENA